MINRWEILFEKGQTYFELENYDKAAETFKKVIAEKPDLVKAMRYLAECNGKLGNKKEAINAYEQIIAFDPNDIETLSKLGSLLLETAQPEKAINIFNKAAA